MDHRAGLNIIKISATYAGTIMGAGFASGQELTQFFLVYGSMGLIGLLITCSLFSWLGIQLLEISYKIKATSYHEVLYYVCGKKIGLYLDALITFSLFGVLTVMLAGAGTIFQEIFALPYTAGLVIMSMALVVTNLYGLKGITLANIIITPLLVVTIIIIGCYSLYYHQLNLEMIHLPPQTADVPAPHWLLSSLLYLSYNLIMGAAVLVPLGSSIRQRKPRIWGSVIGSLLLMFLAGLIAIVLMIHFPEALEQEIPMLCIARSQPLLHHIGYLFIFIASIYTTGLASLYGCATKLTATTKLSIKNSLLIIVTLSLMLSHVGFANLISMLFPLFGYATLWFTWKLFYLSFFPK